MSKSIVMSISSLIAFSLLSSTALADTGKSASDHAPIGVMGDHVHKQGEWMVGYHYEYTRASGLRNGQKSITALDALRTYGEVPTEMDMGMHMFELMYGVTDDLTLMLMPQYMEMGMTHYSNHGHGHMHEHTVEGLGDTEVVGLYSVYRGEHARAHLNLGMSLPTGSSNEKFADHHNNVYNLPYNMQLGSGTYDPILGATYSGDRGDWAWGAQTLNYIRMGKNDEGYRQGNKYTVTAWGAYDITRFASLSLRLEGEAWDNVSGKDARLPLNTIAGANPNEQAGERVFIHTGVNLLAGQELGVLQGQRLAAEFGVPLYERYSGPQPESDYRLTLAWQAAF